MFVMSFSIILGLNAPPPHHFNFASCTHVIYHVAVCRPDNKQNHCRLGKNVNERSSTLEEVHHWHGSYTGLREAELLYQSYDDRSLWCYRSYKSLN